MKDLKCWLALTHTVPCSYQSDLSSRQGISHVLPQLILQEVATDVGSKLYNMAHHPFCSRLQSILNPKAQLCSLFAIHSHFNRFPPSWFRICLPMQDTGDRRRRSDLWVGKILQRRKWQPTPVFLPGEAPWPEEPGRLESMGLQRVRHD